MALVSGLPERVGDGEEIARFLTQRGHFKQQQVSPSAFLPSSQSRETSVSRHGRDPLEALLSLGLAAAGARNLYGAALLKAGAIRAASLEIVADEPPERHAVIRRWPWLDNDAREQRALQLQHALMLASAAGEPVLFNEGKAWISA